MKKIFLFLFLIPFYLFSQQPTIFDEVLVEKGITIGSSDRELTGTLRVVNDTLEMWHVPSQEWIPIMGDNYYEEVIGDMTNYTNQLIYGTVTHVDSMKHDVSACLYYIQGQKYGSDPIRLTLTNSHPTLNRIDVFYVDTSGVAGYLTGTPGSDPAKPIVDPLYQLELTNVYIPAGAIEPEGMTTELVYDENLGEPDEWTGTQGPVPSAGLQVDFDYTILPYQGSKCIRMYRDGSGTVLGNNIDLENDATINLTGKTISFWIRSTKNWKNVSGIQILFWNDNELIKSGFFTKTINNPGFNGNSRAWQKVAFSIDAMALQGSTNEADAIQIRTIGSFRSATELYFDLVQLKGGIIQPPSAVNRIYAKYDNDATFQDGWIVGGDTLYIPERGIPEGTFGQTLVHDGSTWEATYFNRFINNDWFIGTLPPYMENSSVMKIATDDDDISFETIGAMGNTLVEFDGLGFALRYNNDDSHNISRINSGSGGMSFQTQNSETGNNSYIDFIPEQFRMFVFNTPYKSEILINPTRITLDSDSLLIKDLPIVNSATHVVASNDNDSIYLRSVASIIDKAKSEGTDSLYKEYVYKTTGLSSGWVSNGDSIKVPIVEGVHIVVRTWQEFKDAYDYFTTRTGGWIYVVGEIDMTEDYTIPCNGVVVQGLTGAIDMNSYKFILDDHNASFVGIEFKGHLFNPIDSQVTRFVLDGNGIDATHKDMSLSFNSCQFTYLIGNANLDYADSCFISMVGHVEHHMSVNFNGYSRWNYYMNTTTSDGITIYKDDVANYTTQITVKGYASGRTYNGDGIVTISYGEGGEVKSKIVTDNTGSIRLYENSGTPTYPYVVESDIIDGTLITATEEKDTVLSTDKILITAGADSLLKNITVGELVSSGSNIEDGTVTGQTTVWNNTSSTWEPNNRIMDDGTDITIGELGVPTGSEFTVTTGTGVFDFYTQSAINTSNFIVRPDYIGGEMSDLPPSSITSFTFENDKVSFDTPNFIIYDLPIVNSANYVLSTNDANDTIYRTLASSLGGGGGDMSYSDTSAMLAPYITRGDTASMLDYINTDISDLQDAETEVINSLSSGGSPYTETWLDGDIITDTLTENTVLNINYIPEGKTSQIRVIQDATGSRTLTLNLYSDNGTTSLTQIPFGTNDEIDGTAGSITKVIYQRFGTKTDISFIYEN